MNHNFCLWRRGREWMVGENLFSLLPDTIVMKYWSTTTVCVNYLKVFEKWGLPTHIFKLKPKIFYFRLNTFRCRLISRDLIISELKH